MRRERRRRFLQTTDADAYADITLGGMLISMVMFLFLAVVVLFLAVQLRSAQGALEISQNALEISQRELKELQGLSGNGDGSAVYDLFKYDENVYVIDLKVRYYEEVDDERWKVYYICRVPKKYEQQWFFPGSGEGGGTSLGGVAR
ncbi:hypothetical protein HYV70_03960 [Candidatus Uhrbacteria bacterium]|nr:hypothetical protein [Candidatus Uhrbacteria bacterium]